MGPLREIVEVETIEHLFALLAVIGPFLCILIGALYGVKRKTLRQSVWTGLLIGLFGPLNWLLWRVYNAITDANGLDTVRNLLLNLALFVVVGAAIGFGIGWHRLKTKAHTTNEGSAPDPPN